MYDQSMHTRYVEGAFNVQGEAHTYKSRTSMTGGSFRDELRNQLSEGRRRENAERSGRGQSEAYPRPGNQSRTGGQRYDSRPAVADRLPFDDGPADDARSIDDEREEFEAREAYEAAQAVAAAAPAAPSRLPAPATRNFSVSRVPVEAPRSR
jgi:hypothetical protein